MPLLRSGERRTRLTCIWSSIFVSRRHGLPGNAKRKLLAWLTARMESSLASSPSFRCRSHHPPQAATAMPSPNTTTSASRGARRFFHPFLAKRRVGGTTASATELKLRAGGVCTASTGAAIGTAIGGRRRGSRARWGSRRRLRDGRRDLRRRGTRLGKRSLPRPARSRRRGRAWAELKHAAALRTRQARHSLDRFGGERVRAGRVGAGEGWVHGCSLAIRVDLFYPVYRAFRDVAARI